MADYGMAISFSGDVKTASDLDLSLTTKYSFLKGTLTNSGSRTVASNTTETVTIAHGLGYIPSVRFLHDAGGYYASGRYYDSPFYAGDGFGLVYDIQILSRADATNVYLNIYWADWGGGASRTFNYVYYIFTDKGIL